MRGGDISLPLRHLTKLDIRVLSPAPERAELPPINAEPEPPANAHSHAVSPLLLQR